MYFCSLYDIYFNEKKYRIFLYFRKCVSEMLLARGVTLKAPTLNVLAEMAPINERFFYVLPFYATFPL